MTAGQEIDLLCNKMMDAFYSWQRATGRQLKMRATGTGLNPDGSVTDRRAATAPILVVKLVMTPEEFEPEDFLRWYDAAESEMFRQRREARSVGENPA